MAKLELYSTIDEIKKSFDVTDIINDSKGLDSLVSKFNSTNEYIFRGVNNASYKIYASSQRDYSIKGLSNRFSSYNKYLETLFNQSKTVRNGLLLKLYEGTKQNLRYFPAGNNGYIEEDLSYNSFWAFSFIQHYGIPSPLIDFSGDFMASLFFAWDGASIVKSSFTTSDYVQINYFNKEELQSKSDFQSMMLYCIDQTKNSNPQNVTQANQTFISHFDFFNKPSINKIFYVDKSGAVRTLARVPVTFDINVNFNIFNLNILAQEGLFIINYDEKKCLEDIWNSFSLPKMKKILIHKSLIKNIETILINNAGDNFHAIYYPQEEEVVKDLYSEALK